MQQSVRNVFAKYKVDPLRRIRTGARHMVTIQKRFPSNLLEILDVKQIYSRAKK